LTASRLRLLDSAELAVEVQGDGPDLVLVSGLGGTAAFWSPLVASLASEFRVIRFDQRGIGASTRGEAAVSIDTLAQDCLAVLDEVGAARPVLVGHSTGGVIGQSLARLAPGRLGGFVPSGTWFRPNRFMAALFGARRSLLDHDPAAYAAIGAILGHEPGWLEANWGAFEATVAKPPASEAARRVVRERIDALLAFDGSASAASLGVPTLVLGARDDMIVPAFLQEELAAAIPGSRLALHRDGGHFFPVTRPDWFLAELRGFVHGLSA
jgi:aminoacrylate hydrolase